MKGYNPAVNITSMMMFSYEEVDGADLFHEHDLLVNLPWFSRFHWGNICVVSQYSKAGMI